MAVSKQFLLSGTSPAAPGTSVLATITNLDQYTECEVHALLVGATGGTLDIYLQASNNWRAGSKDETGDYTAWSPAGGNWYDVAHFPQLAAGAVAIRYLLTLSRGYSNAAAILVANTADGTPALALNTVLVGMWGGALRLVAVAGASTSAGAVQSVYALASDG
jgi:hypothetical protein